MDDNIVVLYFITSIYSIGLCAVMIIVCLITHFWALVIIQFEITCCMIYMCIVSYTLKREIDEIKKTKNPLENISNNNPILENDILEV